MTSITNVPAVSVVSDGAIASTSSSPPVPSPSSITSASASYTQASTPSVGFDTFHGFPNLPIELRLMIWWSLAVDECTPNNRLVATFIKMPIPALLHTTREARTEALKTYSTIKFRKRSDGAEDGSSIYIHPRNDIVILREGFKDWSQLETELPKVERLALLPKAISRLFFPQVEGNEAAFVIGCAAIKSISIIRKASRPRTPAEVKKLVVVPHIPGQEGNARLDFLNGVFVAMFNGRVKQLNMAHGRNWAGELQFWKINDE